MRFVGSDRTEEFSPGDKLNCLNCDRNNGTKPESHRWLHRRSRESSLSRRLFIDTFMVTRVPLAIASWMSHFKWLARKPEDWLIEQLLVY
jgi:hypothetical protein